MAGARERDVAAAVAAELRAIIARKQLKNVHVAKAAGIPNSTLASILSGGGAIDVDQLARICRQLGVHPGDVLADALNSIYAAAPRVDMAIVDEVLAEETTLTPQQKDSLRKEAAGSDPLSGDSHGERPQRKVL